MSGLWTLGRLIYMRARARAGIEIVRYILRFDLRRTHLSLVN